MSLLELRSKTRKKNKKRVGRGNGSGHGTFSGRGCKGQNSRTGGRVRPGFEGGQTPLSRKMPKLKGFRSLNHIEYQIVNIGKLNIFEDNAKITKEELHSKNLISKKSIPVKLLGGKGELKKSLTIEVDKASESAIKTVEEKKGKVIIIKKEIAPKNKE